MAKRQNERLYLPDFQDGYATDTDRRPPATFVDESNVEAVVFQNPLDLEAVQTFDDPQTLVEHPELREYAVKLGLFESIDLRKFSHFNVDGFQAFNLPFSKLKLLIRQKLQGINTEYLTSGSTDQLPNLKQMYENVEKIMAAAKDLIEITMLFNTNTTNDHFTAVQQRALNYIATCAQSRLYFGQKPYDNCLCILEPVQTSLTRYATSHADSNIVVHRNITALQFNREVRLPPVEESSSSCCWMSFFFCCKPKGHQNNPYRPVPLAPSGPK